jgi:hypothetical protein
LRCPAGVDEIRSSVCDPYFESLFRVLRRFYHFEESAASLQALFNRALNGEYNRKAQHFRTASAEPQVMARRVERKFSKLGFDCRILKQYFGCEIQCGETEVTN